MGGHELKINEVLKFVIENSLITPRQFDIISKRLAGTKGVQNVSRGAYYRLLNQSRAKIRSIIYSILVLELIGIFDEKQKDALARLARQVAVTQTRDIEGTARNVISIMDHLVGRLSRF